MSGKVFIVGIGPGAYEKMTVEAIEAINRSDIVIGYTAYVDLLKKSFPEKQYESTQMRKEIERCQLCLEYAQNGKTVSLVCSGDAGVYGMASPLFELQKQNPQFKDIELTVIPGVTAALAGSAVLGAVLNHDFCLISLSDLLTPWSVIEKRLVCAIEGDFAIALYNPSSHKRKDYLLKACQIMLNAGAESSRACGYVENIGRDGTKTAVCTLGELQNREVNMFTTVFIGNSNTEIYFTGDGTPKLVTKRGYSI